MDRSERRLLELMSDLHEQDRQTLIAFAEFLATRDQSAEEQGVSESVPEPVPLPRREDETVVTAIKRLSQSYYMLDKKAMLHQASGLMAQHVMEGREAEEVIRELEETFENAYQQLLTDGGGR